MPFGPSIKSFWGRITRKDEIKPTAIIEHSIAPSLPKAAATGPLMRCTCGCKGKPYRGQSWVDLNKYKTCPARWRRKDKAKQETAKEREKLRSHVAAVKARAAVNEAKERQGRLKREELERKRNGLPALSKAEARRRNLPSFVGNACENGHAGERDSRNGECLVCRNSDKQRRSAMKRGAFPETLTQQDKVAITAIYEEARTLSKATGIPHHVDHKKPLARGGRHHQDNLQILLLRETCQRELDGSVTTNNHRIRSSCDAFL